jgi:hypothetical protein
VETTLQPFLHRQQERARHEAEQERDEHLPHEQ